MFTCTAGKIEKNTIDNIKVFGGISVYLSKAFDSVSHELIIDKLNVYGVSLLTSKLLYSYLSKSKKMTSQFFSNISFSEFFLILEGVEISSYGHNNTIYRNY